MTRPSLQASLPSALAAVLTTTIVLPTEQLLTMYRTICLIRRVEESLLELAESGKIGGAMHTAIGHEANAVGAAAALRKTDYLTCTYRGHHHSLARGMDTKAAIAEVLGKKAGFAGGKGGSMHFVEPSLGLMGANGIVGAQVPQATGHGPGQQDSRGGSRRHYLLWRWRPLPGAHARDLQHGPKVETPRHLLLRKQPLFRDDAHLAHFFRQRNLSLRQILRHGKHPDRRQRRRGRLHGGEAKPPKRARAGEGPTFIEGRHLSSGWPHGRRPGDLSLQRRDRDAAPV